MSMKRMMIAPNNFGHLSWLGYDTAASGDQIDPHINYCATYRHDYSVRVWEPGREALSQPGYIDPGGVDNRGTEIPMAVTIHGIKGQAFFAFGSANEDLGVWTDDEGAPISVEDADAWQALTGDVNPVADSNSAASEMARRSGTVRMPIFCALYRGTYKQLDLEAGWEIDSGPPDDPAVLLGMDITNPSVLESSRLDWWDMDLMSFPRRQSMRDVDAYATVQAAIPVFHTTPTYDFGNMSNGGHHVYKLNLDANKWLAPGQVLWLHWATGVIKLPVYGVRQAGGPKELTCANYSGHAFSAAVHASMLVSSKLKI